MVGVVNLDNDFDFATFGWQSSRGDVNVSDVGAKNDIGTPKKHCA